VKRPNIFSVLVTVFVVSTVNENFTKMAESWKEQRRFTSVAVEALENHPVMKDIANELVKISAHWPDLDGEWPSSFHC